MHSWHLLTIKIKQLLSGELAYSCAPVHSLRYAEDKIAAPRYLAVFIYYIVHTSLHRLLPNI